MNKKYLGLDLLKFICSVLIIFLHVNPFPKESVIYCLTKALGNLGVPCFFIISGFFFFKKILNSSAEIHNSIFINYIKRLSCLLLFWLVVYFICYDFWWIIDGNIFQNLFEYIKHVLFGGNGFFLWFIVALIIGIAITYFLFKKIKNYLFIIAGALFFIGCIPYAYGFLIKNSVLYNIYQWYNTYFYTVRNGLFFAFPCICLGILLARFETFFERQKTCVIVYLILSILFFVLEVFVLKHYYNLTFATMQLSVVLYCFGLVLISMRLKGEWKYAVIVRKLSFLIYVIHPLIIMLINRLITIKVIVRLNLDYYWYSFYYIQIPVIFAITVGIGLLFIKISRKIIVMQKFM